MAVLISHVSALVLWLANPDTLHRLATPIRLPHEVSLSCSKRSINDAQGALTEMHLLHEKPLDVLMDERTRCYRLRDARPHCLSSVRGLPSGAIVRISDDLYLASPALATCQVAPCLSTIQLASLISTMIGSYTTCDFAEYGLFRRRPLVTISNLKALMRERPQEFAAGLVRKAIPLTFGNCRSPAEVKLAMLLMLPRRYGGFAVKRGSINEHISLDEAAYEMCGQRDAYYDLGWEETRHILEYIGSDAHQDRTKDARRTAALQHMGYDVTEILQKQLESEKFMSRLAADLMAELGQRQRPLGKSVPQRRKDLMKAICGAGDPWCRKLLGRTSVVTEAMRME